MYLYIATMSCSLAAQIVANEINQPLDLVHVDLKTKTFTGGYDYLAINGHGYVPTLVFNDGRKLSETLAILQFLADKKPGTKLIPADVFERAKQIELLNFISTELHQKFAAWFSGIADEKGKQRLAEVIGEKLRFLNHRLSDGRTYLTGETFTASDAYLFAVLPWTGSAEIRTDTLIHLNEWQERVAQRSTVRRALADEAMAHAAHPTSR